MCGLTDRVMPASDRPASPPRCHPALPGLTAKDAQAGIALAHSHLVRDDSDGIAYWRASDALQPAAANSVHLLPPFDEYLVAYRNRSAALDPAHGRQVIGINGLVNASIVVDGRVVGTWKRSVDK